MNRPDADTLTRLHDAQISRFGGSPGVRDHRLLESAVGRLDTALNYVDLDTPDPAPAGHPQGRPLPERQDQGGEIRRTRAG
jgi:hypothetical protein